MLNYSQLRPNVLFLDGATVAAVLEAEHHYQRLCQWKAICEEKGRTKHLLATLLHSILPSSHMLPSKNKASDDYESSKQGDNTRNIHSRLCHMIKLP